MRTAFVMSLALFVFVGCNGLSESDKPMSTDGPNQVVLKVPGMS